MSNDDDNYISGIRCAICGRAAPITVADVTGPDSGDEYVGWQVADLLKPTAPPSGVDTGLVIAETPAWMHVPEAIHTEPDPSARDEDYDEMNRPEFDPERVMCVTHACETERDAWSRQLDETEKLTAPSVANADLTPAEVEELLADLDDD